MCDRCICIDRLNRINGTDIVKVFAHSSVSAPIILCEQIYTSKCVCFQSNASNMCQCFCSQLMASERSC